MSTKTRNRKTGITAEEVTNAIASSTSFQDAAIKVGIGDGTIKEYAAALGLSTAHFPRKATPVRAHLSKLGGQRMMLINNGKKKEEPMTVFTKKCKCCEKTISLSHFYKRVSNPDGFDKYCKDCNGLNAAERSELRSKLPKQEPNVVSKGMGTIEAEKAQGPSNAITLLIETAIHRLRLAKCDFVITPKEGPGFVADNDSLARLQLSYVDKDSVVLAGYLEVMFKDMDAGDSFVLQPASHNAFKGLETSAVGNVFEATAKAVFGEDNYVTATGLTSFENSKFEIIRVN